MKMQLLAVSVGQPQEVEYDGGVVRTGIFKKPVAGPVMMRQLNLDGDGQADLRNHGGTHKAVYGYPHEHYAFWQTKLRRNDFTFGQFGENLTTQGLLEDDVFIGDIYRIGSAVVKVTQPRIPCFKLGIRMSDASFPKQFSAEERCGIYFSVVEEGPVQAGDGIKQLESDTNSVSVRDVFHLVHHPEDKLLLARAAALPTLPKWLKERFRRQLNK